MSFSAYSKQVQCVFVLFFTETFDNVKSVFTNVPFMLLVISTLFAYYIVPGIFGQGPKYLVIQFKIDQAMTSVYFGELQK